MKSITAFVLLVLLLSCSNSNHSQRYTPAPGNLLAEGKIVEVNQAQSSILIQFEVKKIIAYGQATKPIGVKEVIKINVGKESTKPSLQDLKSFYEDQKELVAMLSNPSNTMGDKISSIWNLVFIEEK